MGQWDNASAVAVCRFGRAFTWPLREGSRTSSASHRTSIIEPACIGFRIFLDAAGPIDLNMPGRIGRPSAVAYVDASRTPYGYTLGGIAWGQDWCRWYSLEVAEGSTPLIPWSAGNTINEAESLAASVIIEALASLVGQTDVLLFIDNEVGPGT